ncbi:MAG: hypothetical protein CVU71_03770 [Deltaproteobacteria bacterium HGW-Deltaproteobacteria-6]|jgi:hypothetical protein|nr:MAG: hypothetical protein CVU71_03770 [Deltaproteobacteria bacterium HGW-Deltaproteobacteria-6]
MTNESKKAYEMEYRAQRSQFFRRKCEDIQAEMKSGPWNYDYKEALKALIDEYPKEKALIMEVWREVTGIK